MREHYFLAEACKNTFLLVDLLHKSELKESEKIQIHSELLSLNRDDAMIMINGQEKDGALYIKMLVLGVDFLLGNFCGNGSRAVAAYLYKYYPNIKRFYIASGMNEYELLCYDDDIYATQLPLVNFIPNPDLICDQTLFTHSKPNQLEYLGKIFYYADLLEPHLLLPEAITLDDLHSLGRAVNANKTIFPVGMNITAFEPKGDKYIHAATYERGVQRLTQSCGTGASCAAAFHLNNNNGQVMVKNPGGTLEVSIHGTSLELKGPAHIVKNEISSTH